MTPDKWKAQGGDVLIVFEFYQLPAPSSMRFPELQGQDPNAYPLFRHALHIMSAWVSASAAGHLSDKDWTRHLSKSIAEYH